MRPLCLLSTATAIEVQLIDPQQWLTSCDEDQLAGGTNLAVMGRELIQFADALPLGDGRFRLAGLVRGVAATDPVAHEPGEAFALVHLDALRPVALPTWSMGAEATAKARSVNGEMISAAIRISGAPLIPPAPVHLSATRERDGSTTIRWVRRGHSPAWVDGTDVPLSEQAESYEVTFTGTAGSILLNATAPEVRVGAAQIDGLGAGPVAVEVRQVGDWGASPPASCAVAL